jgi:hypothetical protein
MKLTKPEPPPTLPEIAHAPECAALFALENALHGGVLALAAANPAIVHADEGCDLDRREVLADLIVGTARLLESLLRRYRDAARSRPARQRVFDEDDEPF